MAVILIWARSAVAVNFAFRIRITANRPLPSTLCPLPSTLCPLPSAFCFLPSLPKRVRGLENLFRPRAYEIVFRQVYPPYSAVGIDQKLGGPGNVMPVLTGAGMDQVITTNRLEVWIG